ncbi:hypothetical protein JB92DRAFT_2833894 [Gautieria morchelliformis]|nr:hypothetical protein JB92DRAFT_2833894 [Gautieria morchelliformis]
MCLPRKLESESPSVKSRTFAFNQPSLSFGESWGLWKLGVTDSGSNTEQLPRKKIHGSRPPPLWPPPLHHLPPVAPAPVPACSCPRTFYRFWIVFPAPTVRAPPPLPYILHQPAITSMQCRVCMPRIVMVPAVHAGALGRGRGQGMGDDTVLAWMGLGPGLRSMVCSLVVARGRGAYKSAPALAGGETLRVNDEEVSEWTEGAWEGIEGTEMVPPRSAHGISINVLPFAVPLCLELTIHSRAWEMFAPDNQGSGAINSIDNPPTGEFQVAKYFLGGVLVYYITLIAEFYWFDDIQNAK